MLDFSIKSALEQAVLIVSGHGMQITGDE